MAKGHGLSMQKAKREEKKREKRRAKEQRKTTKKKTDGDAVTEQAQVRCVRSCGRKARQGHQLCQPCEDKQARREAEQRQRHYERRKYGRLRRSDDTERRGRS